MHKINKCIIYKNTRIEAGVFVSPGIPGQIRQFFAGAEGIEPSLAVLETAVLPLN